MQIVTTETIHGQMLLTLPGTVDRVDTNRVILRSSCWSVYHPLFAVPHQQLQLHGPTTTWLVTTQLSPPAGLSFRWNTCGKIISMIEPHTTHSATWKLRSIFLKINTMIKSELQAALEAKKGFCKHHHRWACTRPWKVTRLKRRFSH